MQISLLIKVLWNLVLYSSSCTNSPLFIVLGSVKVYQTPSLSDTLSNRSLQEGIWCRVCPWGAHTSAALGELPVDPAVPVAPGTLQG